MPDKLRPATVRLRERFFQAPFGELLAAPGAVDVGRHLPSDVVYPDSTPQKSPIAAELQAVLAGYSDRSSIFGAARDGEPVSAEPGGATWPLCCYQMVSTAASWRILRS